jgi:hypothetical protein
MSPSAKAAEIRVLKVPSGALKPSTSRLLFALDEKRKQDFSQ